MKIIWATGLAVCIAWRACAAPYADSILLYEPGAGGAPGYDNPLAALGEPSRFTSGEFGGPVDPFSPPFLPEQVVSIGGGGSLTVAFHTPIEDDPLHPFGVDFIIHGNNGFTITNGNFTGGGITDGSTFTFDPPGASRVWVSEDGQTYYELIPPQGLAAAVDGLYPTDGQGDFTIPVNPVLGASSFASHGLPGIRALYSGSGGGTGFDLAWARDAQGASVALCRVRYVRVEVLAGKVEIDAFVAVGRGDGDLIAEDFTCDPQTRGWRRFGVPELFAWNAAAGVLEVTWDSSRTNSYFHRPLGQILSKTDDFTLEFDLRLESIAIGTTPGKPYTFQLAVGLLNWAEATRPEFYRASGIHPQSGPRSLIEFNYFPDSGFGATVAPSVASTNNQIAFGGSYPLELTTVDLFHVRMSYQASNEVLATTMTRNGEPFGLPPDQTLRELALTGFPDFHVDTLAVASYNDGGQEPPEFAGSLLAHGTVDNLRVRMPSPPVRDLVGEFQTGQWTLAFQSRPGYSYVLERTQDFVSWEGVGAPMDGTGADVVLVDPDAAAEHFFYRVRLSKP